MNVVEYLSDHQIALRIVVSLALIALILIARGATVRLLRGRNDILGPQKRRQLFYTRSAFNLALGIGLLLTWLGQVQNLLLSLTAVTVAVVVATKELLMCISGFALRTGASSFSVGDWIEVGTYRGEVTDYNLLSTTILELSPARKGHGHTGNRIVLPNSLFLSHPVRNEKLSRTFILHSFAINVEAEGVDAAAAMAWLNDEAQACFTEFEPEARKHSAAIDQKLGVDIPGPEPVISLATTDTAKLSFQVLLFCPTARAQDLERRITTGLLQELRNRKANEASA